MRHQVAEILYIIQNRFLFDFIFRYEHQIQNSKNNLREFGITRQIEMVNFSDSSKIGKVDTTCDCCDKHGFPCIRCSDVVFNGELGPGYFQGRRLLTNVTSIPAIRNMLKWVSWNPQKDVYVDSAFKNAYSIKEHDLLSINTTLISDPYSFVM